MHKCKYFTIQEFVPPEIYQLRGDKSWELMDERILMMADKVRDKFGRCVINTWHSENLRKLVGSRRVSSGLRVGSSPNFSPTSQHSFGRAIDMLTIDTPVDDVRKYILANPTEFGFISGIELGTSWLHIDCRNCSPIKTFNP